MGILGKLLKKDKKQSTKPITSAQLLIKDIISLTDDSVKVVFDVPEDLQANYSYQPGQYLNFIIPINGKEERRSYSICSLNNEPLAIGVKKIDEGKVSGFFNNKDNIGKKIETAFPIGNFTLPKDTGKFVAFVGGSGITPVLSIAKHLNQTAHAQLHIFYGNRDEKSIMFKEELATLSDKIKTTHILSEQKKEGIQFGMLTQEKISELLKENLELLKADGFYICGPEPVIINAQNALKEFGVAEDKLFYELFTTPELLKPSKVTPQEKFDGIAKITVILDDEEEEFELESNGATILEECESHGLDAPYSCRGAICCTCRAKVLKGKVTMEKNFTLTDKEIEEGYVLTCQAHPNSSEVIVSYDE